MTDDYFTKAARAEAERRHPAPEVETGAQLGYTQTDIREVVRRTFTNAAEWARDHIDSQERTADALTIDQHRVEKRWVGDGVRIECHCGHESFAVWDPAAGLLTEESNSSRVADRLHAVHVADMLARRDEEER